jgi:DNA-binding IclR family transcriptional regulator
MTVRYINAAQQRVLDMLQRLAGHESDGIAPVDLARALATNNSNVTRDLANLQAAGLAEPMESGRWHLTPRIVQISVAAAACFARAQDRLDEARSRYSRNPRNPE